MTTLTSKKSLRQEHPTQPFPFHMPQTKTIKRNFPMFKEEKSTIFYTICQFLSLLHHHSNIFRPDVQCKVQGGGVNYRFHYIICFVVSSWVFFLSLFLTLHAFPRLKKIFFYMQNWWLRLIVWLCRWVEESCEEGKRFGGPEVEKDVTLCFRLHLLSFSMSCLYNFSLAMQL